MHTERVRRTFLRGRAGHQERTTHLGRQGFSKVIEKEPRFVRIVVTTTTNQQNEVLMQLITFHDETGALLQVDVGQLYATFGRVPDYRQARGKRYSLAYLLTVICLAKLAGEHKPAAIAEWIQLRGSLLARLLGVSGLATPSLNTIGRTLASAVSAAELQQACRRFLRQAYGAKQANLVVLDGKTLRGTIPKGASQGVHLLAAYVPDDGLVLDQEAVDGKENEIPAAVRLLARLNLRRRVVGADALLTQRDIARQIRRQGGDYVFYAKDNQRHLLADIRCLFSLRPARPGWFRHALPATVATTVDKQHGRLERRTLTLIPDADGFLDWPGACQVFRLQRHTTTITTGRVRQETVYGLTSLPPATCDAQRLLHLTRSFWSIENGLHYRRDVTLQEDATRMHHRNQAASMATLNNFVVGLLSMLGFTNFASAQRRFADGLMRTLMALLFL